MSINNEPWRYSARQNKWFNNKHGVEGKAPGENYTIQAVRPVSETSNTKPHEVTNNPEVKQEAAAQLEAVVPGLPEKILLALPGESKSLSKEFFNKAKTDLSKFFKDNWGLVSGVTGWTVMRNFLETHKTNPLVTIPTDIPKTPEEMADICIQCMTNGNSTINYERASSASKKLILTEKRRDRISERWTQTTEWKNAVEKWNELLKNHENQIDATVRELIQAAITKPTVANVQKLQQCIGMEAVDVATGQDGILGKRTTAKLIEFIEQINNENVEEVKEGNGSGDTSNIK